MLLTTACRTYNYIIIQQTGQVDVTEVVLSRLQLEVSQTKVICVKHIGVKHIEMKHVGANYIYVKLI